MPDHQWRRIWVGLMGGLVMCVIAACAALSIAVQQHGVAAFGMDQRIGSTRVLGYTTWNARCPPFTGCEPTTKQSYVVWVIEEQGGAPGVVRNSWRVMAVPLELPW